MLTVIDLKRLRESLDAQLSAIPIHTRKSQQEEAVESELAGLEQKLQYYQEQYVR